MWILTYCIHLLFLSDGDFERWKRGEYNIEEENCDVQTPMMIAIENGHLDIVLFLLEKGANINHKNSFGNTPFLTACRCGNVEIFHFHGTLLVYQDKNHTS